MMTEQARYLSVSLPQFAPLFKQHDGRDSNVSWQIIQWNDIPPDEVRPDQVRPIERTFTNRTEALIESRKSLERIGINRSDHPQRGHKGVWKWEQEGKVCYQSVMPVCVYNKSERKPLVVEEKSGPVNAMVRLSEETHKTLRRLAEEEGKTMQAILEEAIKHYEKHLFFKGAEEDYRLLKADPQAWAEELEERKLWENTLMDGIDRNEVWNEDGTVTLLSEKERQVA